jgi:predicted RNase H-like HicB family nuclease
MHYIAVFHPAEERQGGYVVTFPDLPGCVTQGENFDQAFAMAQEALEGFLDVLRQDGDPIPAPSDFQAAGAKAEAEALGDGETLHPAAILQAVPAQPQGAPVRINVSLAPNVLARIDRVAKVEGLTRSGFLAAAARHYMNQIAAEDSGGEIRG